MRKRLKWVLGILIGLGLLVVAVWWEENWRGRRIWEETARRLKALGEPVEIADIIPPPIPHEINVAAAPIFTEAADGDENSRLAKLWSAFTRNTVTDAHGNQVERPEYFDAITPEDMTHLSEWLDYVRAVSSGTLPDASLSAADEMLARLAPWQDVVRELEEAVKRPACRWDLPYEEGRDLDHPLITIAGSAAASLRLWQLAHAAKRDNEKHLDLVLTQLRLARWIHHNGGNTLSLLVAITVRSHALSSIQNMMPLLSYSDEQLRLLQAELASITLQDLVTALRHERVFACHQMRTRSTAELAKDFGLLRDIAITPPATRLEKALSNLRSAAFGMRPRGWNFADAALYADYMQNEVLPCIDVRNGVLQRSKSDDLRLANDRLVTSAGPLSLLKGKMATTFSGHFRIQSQMQARIHQAIAWCALERFRFKHGRLPESLNELVPEFLDKPLLDPASGQPLRYVRVGEQGYRVYSIGWDGKDDGGEETRKKEVGDWTWASHPKLIKNPEQEARRALMAKERADDLARQKAKAALAGKP